MASVEIGERLARIRPGEPVIQLGMDCFRLLPGAVQPHRPDRMTPANRERFILRRSWRDCRGDADLDSLLREGSQEGALRPGLACGERESDQMNGLPEAGPGTPRHRLRRRPGL